MRDAPGDTEALPGDIDTRRDDDGGLNSLGEDRGDVLEIDRDRLAGAVGDIHADDAVVDRDLHAEARRILPVRNPLSTLLLHTRTDQRLHTVAENVLLTLTSKPRLGLSNSRLDDLLLKVLQKVIHLTDLTGLGRCTLLRVGVTPAQAGEHGVVGAILSLLDRNPHRILKLGDTHLEVLSIVLDRDTLGPVVLADTDVTESHLVDVEVGSVDDCIDGHFALVV